MLTGIIIGFAAAVFQSLSYLCSKYFVKKSGAGSWQLIAVSHIYMAIFSIILLIFYWDDNILQYSRYLKPLLFCALFYFTGQLGLFMALKYTEASRVSPLLGLKLIILTVISVVFMDKAYTPLQYVSVVICFVAAVMLNYSGEKIAVKALLWIVVTCSGYSISDINIGYLVDSLSFTDRFGSVILAASLCYALCGVFALVFLAVRPVRSLKIYKAALPFSVFWFSAMLAIFACISILGVVYANIIQSTRGIVSIILGIVIASKGYDFLEIKIGRDVFVKRLIAGVLMFSAIVLFSL